MNTHYASQTGPSHGAGLPAALPVSQPGLDLLALTLIGISMMRTDGRDDGGVETGLEITEESKMHIWRDIWPELLVLLVLIAMIGVLVLVFLLSP